MTKRVTFGIEKQRFTRRYTAEGPKDNQPNPNYKRHKLTIAEPSIWDANADGSNFQCLKVNYWAEASELPAILEEHQEHQETIAEYHRQRNQGESKDEPKTASSDSAGVQARSETGQNGSRPMGNPHDSIGTTSEGWPVSQFSGLLPAIC